jgi:diguanylate cyclase (GGDEF)-like protein
MHTNKWLNTILITIAISGVTLSCVTGWLLYEGEERSILSELQRHVDERAASLHREVLMNFESLRSLAIMFNGATIPNHEQFQSEARKILSRYDDIQALEWIPRIVHRDRDQHEAARKRYFPDYEIRERKQQGIMVRAATRPEYYPVSFVEPAPGNEAALGFDLASSPSRLEALEKSRDNNAPQATASITLVQETEQQKGFLAFLPVYRDSSLTVEHRRKNLIGFVLGVYRIGDIFLSSDVNEQSLDIEMKLIDETAMSMREVVFVHESGTKSSLYKDISYRKELPEIWGQKWSLIASPSSSYVASKRNIFPQAIFVIGNIFTVIVVMYIKLISQLAATIQVKVNEKTNELSEVNRKLELLSRSDGLTGIANRRLMDEVLEKEWLRAIRNKSNISFVLIDIDFFKLYNDGYGHLMGDECLKKVAATLREIPSRPTDLVARYGGEEFALVLAETRKAQTVAEQCRRLVEELQIQHEFSHAANVVTISVGVCTYSPRSNDDPRQIIDSADKALYKAKEAGRNRVVVSETNATELVPKGNIKSG